MPFTLYEGDAFVIPPGMATRWGEPSEDLEILEVTLPGGFETVRSDTNNVPASTMPLSS